MDHKELLDKYHYDPLTGEFIYLKSYHKRYIGSVAGTIGSDGYKLISFINKQYRRGRLAFFYMTGKWPYPEIDHIDNNITNDRWNNLREATSSQQKTNRGVRSDNSTGVTGVSFDKKRNKYEAYVFENKKKINLGIFDTLEEATLTRKIAQEDTYGPYSK